MADTDIIPDTNEELDTKDHKLIYNGVEYSNTPRMAELIKRAGEIEAVLPPAETGFVRLWRGNRVDEVGKNPSFTTSLPGIALPFSDFYNGPLTYVDVPVSNLSEYLTSGAKDSEFELPSSLFEQAKVVDIVKTVE